jgi:hypothetical protein
LILEIIAARPAYDVREMTSTAHDKPLAGDLFVVSGTVVNVGKDRILGNNCGDLAIVRFSDTFMTQEGYGEK